jgi:uncharacterized integral membrane protein
MKELTLTTLIAVFEEMFGAPLFWAMVAAAIVVTVLYVYVLIRDRTVSMRKFFWAQISMPIGAVAAVAFVLWATSSELSDLGGPVDAIVFLAIAGLGAVGVSILVYTAQSLMRPGARGRR